MSIRFRILNARRKKPNFGRTFHTLKFVHFSWQIGRESKAKWTERRDPDGSKRSGRTCVCNPSKTISRRRSFSFWPLQVRVISFWLQIRVGSSNFSRWGRTGRRRRGRRRRRRKYFPQHYGSIRSANSSFKFVWRFMILSVDLCLSDF